MAWNSGYVGPHIDPFGELARGAGTVRDMIAQAQQMDMARQKQAMEALHTKFQEEQSRRNGDLYERQIANSEATQKRMDRRDKAGAIMEYKRLMEAGDVPGAQAILHAYDMLSEEQAGEPAQPPQAAPHPQPGAQQPMNGPPQAQPVPQPDVSAAAGGMDPRSSWYAQVAGAQTTPARIPGVSLETPASFDDSETLGRNMTAVFGDAEARAAQPGVQAPAQQVAQPAPAQQAPEAAPAQPTPATAAQASVAQNTAAAKALRKKFRIRGEDGDTYAEGYDPEAARETALARQDEDRARQEALAARQREERAGRWAAAPTSEAAQNPVTQEIYAIASEYIKRGADEKTALAEARQDVLGRMNAQRPRSNGYRPPDPGGFKAADDARNDFTGYVSATGYKLTRGEYYKYQQMADALRQENAALDSTTAGAWTKLAQGGTGVVSDNDVKVFWKRIGGLGVQTADQLEGILTGKISHPKRNLVLDAARWLSDKAAAKLQADREGAEVLMEKYGPNGQRYLRAYYGDAPGGGEAAGGKAGAPDKVDLLLQKLGGKK